MNISDAITFLESKVPNPSSGLPDEVFYYISRNTPLVNVDLLIKDQKGRTLLSWRNDRYCGKGWHLPGGIIRLRETMETRVRKVAETEIGTSVLFEPIPIAVNQIITDNLVDRSHFVSILFKCFLDGAFVPANKGMTEDDPGYLSWHEGRPHNLLKYHEIYSKYLQEQN